MNPSQSGAKPYYFVPQPSHWPITGSCALLCMAFGAAVAVIPISAGLDATREPASAPGAVMGGMVRLFFALGLIEIAALALKYV